MDTPGKPIFHNPQQTLCLSFEDIPNIFQENQVICILSFFRDTDTFVTIGLDKVHCRQKIWIFFCSDGQVTEPQIPVNLQSALAGLAL